MYNGSAAHNDHYHDHEAETSLIESYVSVETEPDHGMDAERFHLKFNLSSRTKMNEAFLLGILFTISHHVFYQHLDGQAPWTGSYQEWPIRIGSILAFLTILFMSTSICEAYTQEVWTALADSF